MAKRREAAGAITNRRATLAQAAAVARIMGDPAVYPGLMQLPFTSEEIRKARQADNFAPGKSDPPLLAGRGGEVVGSAGLHAAEPALRRRDARTLGISVARVAQRQGVGSALMAALCDYADRWAGALRIELTVYADNAAAIELYRRFGFEHEGTRRAYALRDGAYVDALAIAPPHYSPPLVPIPAFP